MIWCLLLLNAAMLGISWQISRRDYFSPPVLFSFSFFFSACWAAVFCGTLQLGLHFNTFLVLFLGALEYCGVCIAVRHYYPRSRKFKRKFPVRAFDAWKKIAFIAFEAVTVISILAYFVVLGREYSLGSLTEVISLYRSNTTIDKVSSLKVELPTLISYMKTVVYAGSYWFIGVLAYNTILKKQIDRCSIIIIVISIVLQLLLGGRSGPVCMVFSFLCCCHIMYYIRSGHAFRLTVKSALIILGGGAACILLFFISGIFMGRSVSAGLLHYLIKYFGAPIKNLDIYLNGEQVTRSTLFGEQTFFKLVKWIGPKVGLDVSGLALDLPYQSVDGFNLGNVYTTFYAYIHDFGYIGLVIFVLLIAVISQVLYCKLWTTKKFTHFIYYLGFYGYFSSAIILSFFSNKMYEAIFSYGFIQFLIIWKLCEIFFFHFDIIKFRDSALKLIGKAREKLPQSR